MSNHTYWRLYITQSMGLPGGQWWWHSIAEIEMRATPGGADQCNGGIATAHDYYSGYYEPACAFDNSADTFWGSWSSNQVAGWIQYQFPSPVSVTELSITARNAPGLYSPKDFMLQWSDDNSNWTTVGQWKDAYFAQWETKLFRLPIATQNRMPYGMHVAVGHATPYAMSVASEQRQVFDLPALVVSSQVAMPFSTLLMATSEQPYEGDLVRQFTASYDLTTQAVATLEQPFGIVLSKTLASPYAMPVAASLATGYASLAAASLEQPYLVSLTTASRQPHHLSLAVQHGQSFDYLFAANACAQPAAIQLEVYHVQPWQMPVAQASRQPLYDTVCAAGRQSWSIRWLVAQANGQSFDRTVTVAASHGQPHDLLARNPVVKSLTGSWDLSAARPPLRLDGGVRAIHFGVSL